MRKYEGMFLFDPAATADWESVQTELGRLLDRVNARVIVATKWDERRLAYEIRGRKRGIYALTYFEADPSRIIDLERDAQLSDAVLRCLVVRADHLSEEDMKEAAARPASTASSEDDEGGRPWGRRRDRDEGRPDARARERGRPERGSGGRGTAVSKDRDDGPAHNAGETVERNVTADQEEKAAEAEDVEGAGDG